MNIGVDTYLELDYKSALSIIENKLTFLNKKKEIITEQIIKNKAYSKLTGSIINEIQKSSNIKV